MKKMLFLLGFLFISGICFADYVIVDKDESDPNQKIYGTQLEQASAWIGIQVTSTSVNYNQGTSTTTYSQWWIARKSVGTKYRNGFTYKSFVYPN